MQLGCLPLSGMEPRRQSASSTKRYVSMSPSRPASRCCSWTLVPLNPPTTPFPLQAERRRPGSKLSSSQPIEAQSPPALSDQMPKASNVQRTRDSPANSSTHPTHLHSGEIVLKLEPPSRPHRPSIRDRISLRNHFPSISEQCPQSSETKVVANPSRLLP